MLLPSVARTEARAQNEGSSSAGGAEPSRSRSPSCMHDPARNARLHASSSSPRRDRRQPLQRSKLSTRAPASNQGFSRSWVPRADRRPQKACHRRRGRRASLLLSEGLDQIALHASGGRVGRDTRSVIAVELPPRKSHRLRRARRQRRGGFLRSPQRWMATATDGYFQRRWRQRVGGGSGGARNECVRTSDGSSASNERIVLRHLLPRSHRRRLRSAGPRSRSHAAAFPSGPQTSASGPCT